MGAKSLRNKRLDGKILWDKDLEATIFSFQRAEDK